MTCTQQRFERDVAQHQMTVVRDNSVDRHIKFRKPDSSSYWFEILTWPGALCIRGDCGTYVFSRLTDMLEFFRTDAKHAKGDELGINPQYWMEKIIAVDSNCGHQGSAKKFSLDEFKRKVVGWFRRYTEARWYGENREHRWAVWEAIRELIEEADSWDASHNYQLLRDFSAWIEGEARYDFHNFFDDFWEVDCTEYDFSFIWNCYAIAWAIRQYDAAKLATQEAA